MEKYVPTYEESVFENLESHAKYELRKAGLFDKDSDYGGMLGNAVMQLVKVFAGQGHSGFSAQYVLSLFSKVAGYKTLTPITADPDEWEEVSKYGDDTSGAVYQNKRCPSVFSNDGLKTWYDLDDKKVSEAYSCIFNGINESVFDPVAMRMWAVWSRKFYFDVFEKIGDALELGKKYEELRNAYAREGERTSGELLKALRYFFDYRKRQLEKKPGIMESHVMLFEEYDKNGKKKQRWFTLKKEKWDYFYEMIYKHSVGNVDFAKRVLQSVKDANYRCSETQYDYLKRAAEGINLPDTYGTKN